MNNLTNLVYYIGNRKIETILYKKPIAICKWKAKELKKLKYHTLGYFKFE